MSNNNALLKGVLVLDLSRVLAGPFAALILRQLGARVIKVENPRGGDESRGIGPFKEGVSGYFMNMNAGKESLALDLGTPKGQSILKTLVKRADILVENFRPGVMTRWGLGYDVLKEINPRLVYLAITGFGYSGPLKDKPAYDMIIQAMSGLLSITGPEHGEPARVGASVSDLAAALFGVIGTLSALFARERSGASAFIDAAMYDASIGMLENAIIRTHIHRDAPRPLGTRHPTISPFQVFPTQDRPLVLAVVSNRQWEKLCRVLGREELISDPRFKDNALRTEHHAELEPELSREFKKKTLAAWTELLEAEDVPVAPVQDIPAMMAHPQTLARNMLVELLHPLVGSFKTTGFPLKFAGLEEPHLTPAPDLGAQTQALLSEFLNFNASELSELKDQGVVYYP